MSIHESNSIKKSLTTYLPIISGSSALEAIVSITALSVLLFLYHPWSASGLAAMGGWPVLTIPSALALAGLAVFIISASLWIIYRYYKNKEESSLITDLDFSKLPANPFIDTNQDNKREGTSPIANPPVQVVEEVIIETFTIHTNTKSDPKNEVTGSSDSKNENGSLDAKFVIVLDPRVASAPSANEFTEASSTTSVMERKDKEKEKEKEKEEDEVIHSSPDTSPIEVKEKIESVEKTKFAPLSKEEIDEINRKVTDVVDKTFRALFANVIKAFLKLLDVHAIINGKKDDERKKIQADATDAFSKVSNVIVKGMTEDAFILYTALSHLLEVEQTNRTLRLMGASFYAGDAEQLGIYLDWYEELERKLQLHGSADIIKKDIATIRKELPGAVSKCFSRHDPFMIELIEVLLTQLFADTELFPDDEITRMLADVEKEAAQILAEGKVKDPQHYADPLRKMIFSMFEKSLEKHPEIYASFGAYTKKHLFLDMGISRKVGPVLKMVAKGLDVLKIYLNSKKADDIVPPLFSSFYSTENKDIGDDTSYDFSNDKLYQELLTAQAAINNEIKSQKVKDKAEAKNRTIALIPIPKKNTYSKQEEKALEILTSDKRKVDLKTLSKNNQNRITNLQNKFVATHDLIIVRCQQQGGAKELATLKNCQGYAGTAKRSIAWIIEPIINVLIKLLDSKDLKNNAKPDGAVATFISKLANSLADVFTGMIDEHREKLRKLNLKGVDPAQTKEFHQGILDIIPLLAGVIVDTFLGDEKNEFHRKVILELLIKKDYLRKIQKVMDKIADSLNGETPTWDVLETETSGFVDDLIADLDNIANEHQKKK